MNRFFLIFFLLSSSVSAQFVEHWTNSDFSSPPTWQGDLLKFYINTNEKKLKLNAPAEKSEAFISTFSQAINNAIWEFSVNMQFNPSSSNYAKIFLVSNQAMYNEDVEGYYVMIGNTQDEVSLWKRVNGTNSKIIDGRDKILDDTSNSVSVKVVRDDSGNWQLYTKQNNSNYILEGDINDLDIIESSYFGIYCKYSSTRSDKFSFGSIDVKGTGYVDSDKPRIVSHQLISGNQFSILFSEAPNATSISTNDFTAEPSVNPDRFSAENKMVNIFFKDYLSDINNGKLIISDIEDEAGNTINDTSLVYNFERIKLLDTKVISSNAIQLTFNKKLDVSYIFNAQFENTLNFVSSEVINDSSLIIASKNAITPEEENKLIISNVKSEFGDIIKPITTHFIYRIPKRFDIVFSELMPDPSPNIGLFDSEYIELYNRTDYSINLENYNLVINDKETFLPNYELPALGYVIIINEKDIANWPENISTIGIKGLPALTNSSGTLILYHSNNLVCDVIQYPLQLNYDSFKSDGGWSYEKLDFENHQPDFNWQYSNNLKGGTPGEENSVLTLNPDVIAPSTKYISYVNPSTYEIIFSESLNFTENYLNDIIKISEATVDRIEIDPIFLNKLSVSLKEDLSEREIYKVSFLKEINDFGGNALLNHHSLRIGVPEEVDSFDICINEILFNPTSDGVDFVELYNRSDKIINQAEINLSSINNLLPEELMPINNLDRLFFPNDYLVVTEDSGKLKSQYNSINSEMVTQANIPSLNDNEGSIAITLKNGELLDFFEYHDDMHFELLRDKEGVSLERINPNASSGNNYNWHSASKQSGYATPTLLNSQFSDKVTKAEDLWLSVDNKELSPNSDGIDDYVQINYKLDESGWSGTVKVYNKYGRAVKTIANNELLATRGFFIWDGTTDNHEKAEIGIYIIYSDIFSSTGKRKQEKLTVVVTAGERRQ